MDIENIKKILVIRLGAVGDIIRTLPAVKYIFEFYKKQNKEIIIHWLAEKHNSNILKDLPYIDKIYKLPRRDWQNRLISKDFFKVLREFNEFIKKIKNEKYDAVIDFHGIFKSGLLSYLSGCPVRIGYTKEYCKELNFMFNNVRIAAKSQKITRIEKNFALVSYFDTSYEIPEKFDNLLNITEPDKFVVDNFLKEKKINNFICINPAVSKFGKYKEWREDYYARLTELILNFAGEINIIFTWGPGELEKINRIIKGIDFNKIAQKTERIFIAPQTTLKELAYLIS
ncbi:MAG TPA: glycosyltransferase family 9 protein, partial [bacterium]|nr:glycosyltransferase family 9 protein [bacterium]